MQDAPDILKKIIDHKKTEVLKAQQNISLDEIKELTSEQTKNISFVQAIQKSLAKNTPAVIAEIKRASPSQGIIRENFNPQECAISYQNAGASCLSVLTDEKFFQGSDEYLKQVKQVTNLPILRKDFIIDSYQVYQSKQINADCILLIAAVLTLDKMQELSEIAKKLNLDVLVEVHNLSELEKSLKLNLPIIGINNRNLHTFNTNLQTTIDLLKAIPKDKIVVTESGISQKQDVELMQKNSVNSFLVGEVFMKAKNPGEQLKKLFF